MPDKANVGKRMADAAKRARVRRFVFSSVIHPTLTALEYHAAKGAVAEAILASDMEYTFLHPTLFFQNYAGSWPTHRRLGRTLVHPRITRVDYRDVADMAAIALPEDRLAFGTFELCAEGNLSRRGVAALMGEVGPPDQNGQGSA